MKNTLSIIIILTCGLLATGCEQKNNSTELSAYPKNGQCSIDVPAKNTVLPMSEDFHIGGWAFNKVNNTTSDSLTIYFRNIKTNELVSIPAKTGHKRPDVAKALGNTALENSGFNALMEKDKLPQGDYEIILIQADLKAGVIACENEKHLIKIK